MNRSHEIVTGALCLALLGAAFCAWSALGNEVNLCVTAGCSLYQDTTLAGISLWWLGAGSPSTSMPSKKAPTAPMPVQMV